jgi:hypothetical protein
MAYIYPDLETAIVGEFSDLVLVSGRTSKVLGERCNDFGLKEVDFAPVDPDQEPVFFSPPTNTSFGDGPRG